MKGALILCESELQVTLTLAEGRAKVVVVDGITAELWCDIEDLQEVLAGTPLQLSCDHGYCLFEADKTRVVLQFSVKGGGQKRCEFPRQRLQNAIQELKGG